MNTIDREKFGDFIARKRKEKKSYPKRFGRQVIYFSSGS